VPGRHAEFDKSREDVQNLIGVNRSKFNVKEVLMNNTQV